MRKSDAMIDQIRDLFRAGHRVKKIARSLGISKNTVKRYIRNLDAAEAVSSEGEAPAWVKGLDLPKITQELAKGATLKQLFSEVAPDISYSQFCRYLKANSKQLPPVNPALIHKPGETTQIDYADGLYITDRKTGSKLKTHLFCGVLPFSSLTYAEFSKNQKLPEFIRSQERMWAYFGGVTLYAIVDNLKSGVTKAHRYDPDVNPTYCDYGNHTGFAVLPARPRTPRDKAAVEAAIGVIQRGFYQKYRAEVFYSLAEMNQALRVYIDELNNRIMQDYGVSRRERFANERCHLLPLPKTPYEISEIKQSKVHPDCCIQIAKALYSVPFQHVGQTVYVKVSDKTVVIYDITNCHIATHVKQPIFGRSIVEDHMPPHHIQMKSFDVIKSKAKAEAIGPETKAYIDWQFDDPRPLRVLRRVQGIIRLYEGGTAQEAMEYAALQAKQFRRRDLKYFEDCAEYFSKTGGRPIGVDAPKRDLLTLHLNGGN